MQIETTECLLILAQISGIMLLGGTLLLLFFRRIYIDSQTGQPTEIEIPLIGIIRTQAPAFALIVVAAFLVIYPISRAKQDLITLEGSVDTGGKSVTVLVVAVPNYQITLDSEGPFSTRLPLLKDSNYRVKFVVDKSIIADREAKPDEKGVYKVKAFAWSPPLKENVQQVKTKKEITDEELRNMGIAN